MIPINPDRFHPALVAAGVHIPAVRAYIRARLGFDLTPDAVHPRTGPDDLAATLDHVAARTFPADPIVRSIVFKLRS